MDEIINMNFILKADEVKEGLKINDKNVSRNRKKVLNTVLLTVAMVLFGYQLYKNNSDAIGILGVVVCFFILLVIWLAPAILRKNEIKSVVDGRKFEVFINENGLSVVINSGEEQVVPKSEIFKTTNGENVVLITLKNRDMLIIPKREINDLNKILEFLR